MKKRFNLQLLADDATDTTTETSTQEAGTQPNEADTKKYSDTEVDEIVKGKKAKWRKEWQKEQEKAVKEAEKLAGMNAQEKAEHERDELQKQLDDYKKKDAIAEMSKVARKMLSDEQITISDSVLSVLVSDDAEATKTVITAFAKSYKADVEAAVKERLKGEPPRKGTTSTVGAMTKEQIMAIADPELRQKKMLENKHLFNF